MVGPYWEKLCPLSRVRPSACGLGPYSRPRAQFFPIRTSRPVNNIYIFTRKNNKLLSQVFRLPLLKLHNLKKYIDGLWYDRDIIGSSSEIFGRCLENVWKRSSSLRNNFGKSSEIFRKWSEIFRKSSKTSLLVCLYNKQNITCPLVDMKIFYLLVALTREISSWTLEDKIHIHARACNILSIRDEFLKGAE